MNETKEYNAATIEKALEVASENLGIPKEDLSYEVLDDGSAGFLGMGSRDARIEVVSSDSPEAAEATEAEQQDAPVAEPASYEANSPTYSAAPAAPAETDEATSDDSPTEEPPPAPEELLNEVEHFANHSVEAMGLDARIDVYDAKDFIAVDVTSAEAGIFIGQKGETIDAFQYLLNVAAYRDRPYVKRIIVDSEGYRQRRVEAVQGIAHRMARKAMRESRMVELPPMNTSERRIVHVFLKENTEVSTASQGTGGNRRVTVSPAQ